MPTDIDTVLITCVGGGGANNAIRSFRRSDRYDMDIIGTDSDRVLASKSLADETFVVPKGNDGDYVDVMSRIVDDHDVDVFVPQHEVEVQRVSEERDAFDCSVLLPQGDSVKLCLDKLRLQRRLDDAGFEAPETVSLENYSVREAFDELSDGEPLWFRSRFGSGSMEALPLDDAEQAKQWVEYCENNGGDRSNFTLSEFLPGKDYQIFMLWDEGELVLGKACDRRRYFFGQEHTGASTPLVSRMVDDDELNETARAVIDEVAPNASGNLGVDFKVAPDGTPKVTEVNVGKFVMVNNFFNMTGEYNMAELFLDVAAGRSPRYEDPFGDIDTEQFLVRGIDLEPDILSIDEIESIQEYD
ncbi:ATP-grasp domain-containing protein [Natronomonas sp. F2-12]|uniref:ATP-grasp domain-containing protein n=1 Tax=Natronomonas aquatica TaxID=2841590 RepID=A0A9R1CW95_9EURY|nr:ATP-grasp domain-containing protein [Natronomonas aquatica]MCQ4334917.1 ATP-grasp domain-containing protein [Natronomonas aquatica]